MTQDNEDLSVGTFDEGVVTIETIEQEKADLLAKVPAMTSVTTIEEANAVSAHRAKVKAYRGKVEAFFRPGISQANKLWKTLLGQLSLFDDPAAAAEKRDNALISEYQIREEQKRQAAQDVADAEARRIAAEKARAEGDKKTADAIESGKIAVVSDTVVASAGKIEGNTTVWLWRVTVTDKAALVKAIAKGTHPAAWLDVNESAINKFSTSCDGQLPVAGCKVEKIPSQRGRSVK